jgi:aminomethyltransferase
LYDVHVALGGKIVPFAGYSLPIQYAGVIAEHMAVRKAAGLFDVSHMGEILYTGPDALANLEHVMTNVFSGMGDGRARYSLICNEDGGVVDDVLVYRRRTGKYLVVVNAANIEKDFKWMRSRAFGDVSVTDISGEVAQIALQGPRSREILTRLAPPGDIPEKYYTFKEDADIGGIRCLVSRTGYTGELGYELYSAVPDAAALWKKISDAGEEFGLLPAGLGARDTLRLEAGMPLYGHEMDETVTPFEAGLDFAVKMTKENFVGRAALERRKPERARVGLRVTGRGIVREGATVYADGRAVGRTTSGTHCPYLGGAYAMASVGLDCTSAGIRVEADVRGRMIEAEVADIPFYSRTRSSVG